jgi:DNA-binding transcriptional MerR regulator
VAALTISTPTASIPTAPDADRPLGIAEVAELMGLTAHTLRYYERIGLLDVPRDAGGRRRYSPGDLARVHFITCLRRADLPINRIQHYFELVEEGPHTEPERLALLEDHRREVLGRLAELQTALDTIEFKITMYGGGHPGDGGGGRQGEAVVPDDHQQVS